MKIDNENIGSSLKEYVELKAVEKRTKDNLSIINSGIKDFFRQEDILEIDKDGVIASLSITETETFNNEKLLAKVKEIGADYLIKTVEVVDMEMFESSLRHNEIEPTLFKDCVEVSVIERLNVKVKK